MQNLNLSYNKWKQVRSALSLQLYYILEPGNAIDIVIVDLSNGFVYVSHLTKAADLADFVANIQPNASQQLSIDECIASTVGH